MHVPKVKPQGICDYGACPDPAMKPAEVTRKLGDRAPRGLCPAHTLGAVMALKASTLPTVTAEYHDAAPYAEWVSAAAASGTLRYQGLTVTDLRQTDLARVLGVHRVTVSRLINGHLTKVRKPVATRLNPYLTYVHTTPAWGLVLGQRVGAAELAYAPLGTCIVDYYGRAWQLRGNADNGQWCPAHLPDPRPSRARGTDHAFDRTSPSYPARVVDLPARVFDELNL